MATSDGFFEFIKEQLSGTEDITFRKMMGEYMLYKDGILFGGVYDNRFLIKNVTSLKDYNLKEQIPYPNAKPMLLIDSEDPDEIKEMVLKAFNDLKK